MTRDEVKKIFGIFSRAYRDFLPEDREEVEQMITLWEIAFLRRTYKECEWAAMEVIKTSKYPPTPAHLAEYLGEMPTLNDKLARLPMKDIEPTYADETHMEAAFMRLMRDLNKAKPMVGNQPPTVQDQTEGR